MAWSFIPGASAFVVSNYLLFASPLATTHVIAGFSSLMILQLIGLKVDYYFTDKENAPLWFRKYRRQLF